MWFVGLSRNKKRQKNSTFLLNTFNTTAASAAAVDQNAPANFDKDKKIYLLSVLLNAFSVSAILVSLPAAAASQCVFWYPTLSVLL